MILERMSSFYPAENSFIKNQAIEIKILIILKNINLTCKYHFINYIKIKLLKKT